MSTELCVKKKNPHLGLSQAVKDRDEDPGAKEDDPYLAGKKPLVLALARMWPWRPAWRSAW